MRLSLLVAQFVRRREANERSGTIHPAALSAMSSWMFGVSSDQTLLRLPNHTLNRRVTRTLEDPVLTMVNQELVDRYLQFVAADDYRDFGDLITDDC